MASQPLLCATCDTYVRHRALPRGVKAYCPRCKSTLFDAPYCDLDGLAALALAALIIYFPANLLPILELNLVGNLRQTTVLDGALLMLDQGFVLVGVAVLVTGVIAPLALLLSVLVQLTLLKLRIGQRWCRKLLLFYGTLSQLSMVEIYMISFLVSIFKLSDIALLSYGWGTFTYVLLFVLLFYVQYEYNNDIMWDRYEQAYA